MNIPLRILPSLSRRAALLLRLSTASLVLSASAAVSAAPQPSLDTCDHKDFQTLLNPADSARGATAFWLNRELIKWPGKAKTGKFRLYYAANGQLQATSGIKVTAADGWLELELVDTKTHTLPSNLSRFTYLPDGVVLKLGPTDLTRLASLLKQQLVLVNENEQGNVLSATYLQTAGALDDLYASAKQISDLGAKPSAKQTQFKLWAPTAKQVWVCSYNDSLGKAKSLDVLHWDDQTGVWSANKNADLSGKYYLYVVDVFVPGVGVVRNRVTDPYSVSLAADSKRSYIQDLNSPRVTPKGWDNTSAPIKIEAQTDLNMYELHVRDFSINDPTVSPANRGKYLGFTESESNGIKHLRALATAGLTDIHLLPVYDIATIPEINCVTPAVSGAADSEVQQETISAIADKDCFNWGYDPYHYNSPEGSYSTDPTNGGKRILELRHMIMALHKLGLRVGMDVVYNHTFASGQTEFSVLDRIVPGYYHRYNLDGQVEKSTCCENTATENLMMGKLLIDSVVHWATAYKMDSFRFDLMAHQPRALMEELQIALKAATPRTIHLIGEGWNFGEVSDGARFVQASQLSLGGTGIATFTDRARDFVRGQRYGDSGEAWITHKGYINGLANPKQSRMELLKAADMIRVGLAGSLKDYSFVTQDGTLKPMREIDYSGNPAGYTHQPGEAVNYVENHDNQTLFDINAYKLPPQTSRQERARAQVLGLATTTFSQGIAYFHAGVEILRSKSMDRDSFNSGDWFNRLDWSYNDNYFGTGIPPKLRNADYYSLVKPVLANPAIKPTKKEILLTRNMFLDLLTIRSSSTLFRLKTAEDVKQRLHFYNTGPEQNGAVIAGKLDGKGYPGAEFTSLIYFINVATETQTLAIPEEKNRIYQLHPVHTKADAADKRPATTAKYDEATGRFTIPARTALVFVEVTK